MVCTPSGQATFLRKAAVYIHSSSIDTLSVMHLWKGRLLGMEILCVIFNLIEFWRAYGMTVQEDTLADLVMKGAGGFALSSLIGKGPKFGGLDIKRIYFGCVLYYYQNTYILIRRCVAIG
jgi:hypothetical protein